MEKSSSLTLKSEIKRKTRSSLFRRNSTHHGRCISVRLCSCIIFFMLTYSEGVYPPFGNQPSAYLFLQLAAESNRLEAENFCLWLSDRPTDGWPNEGPNMGPPRILRGPSKSRRRGHRNPVRSTASSTRKIARVWRWVWGGRVTWT